MGLEAEMTPRSHLWLRLGALALLVAAALWPRGSRAGHEPDGMTAAEVMRGASDAVLAPLGPRAPHGVAFRGANPTAGRGAVSRGPKGVVVAADESRLNN
jgi:hypothetical protein